MTGTVPDIRPYLWSSAVSIVPLRIGGGTRLKIYESMAGRVPVVTTAIGSEGLEVSSPHNIRKEDSAEKFATACLELLQAPALRSQLASAGWDMVASNFSWERVAGRFDDILQASPKFGEAPGPHRVAAGGI